MKSKLAENIKSFQAEAFPQMKPHVLETLFKGVEDLELDKIEKNALKVGDKMPPFTLTDAKGEKISSDKLLEQGSLVISFYRGGWCPYCNLELRALQTLVPEYKKNNATLIAISPEKPDDSLSTQEKNELKFPVLSDNNNDVARSMGLLFEVPKEVVDISKSEWGLDFSEYNGTEKHELPIPATYVVNTEGIVKLAFVNPDYTKRAEPWEILTTLASLNTEGQPT
ncbi:peroxiredoxin-like family protein [Xanthovirga aplysinae]|uniref:peroxiredoxin-like family protein n=1 Tax=Xanthovirga aplysinae TaxID=2529853 RepID=UPI0012BC3223|nr:peroxiredoxin-like family protein [Xanthovirga aplysinae]MTI29975.1 AhpC/TSA family protein [Xanthovirga aplysinae]